MTAATTSAAPLHVYTADSGEWVIASSPEDARDVYAAHLGAEPEKDDARADACDYGLHVSHWSELPDDKVLKRVEECPDTHARSVTCPNGCDDNFLIHRAMTCAEWVAAEGRGYWGSANW